jgi:hypothetical protein
MEYKSLAHHLATHCHTRDRYPHTQLHSFALEAFEEIHQSSRALVRTYLPSLLLTLFLVNDQIDQQFLEDPHGSYFQGYLAFWDITVSHGISLGLLWHSSISFC